MSIFELEQETLHGEKVSLDQYKGDVIIVVNTASKCGFTPQYEELETLYQEYKDKGFTVLGFPSDSFMNQELDSSNEIEEFCKINYGVTFPLFAKSKVRGSDINPVFEILTKQKKGLLGGGIKWNFTKFLLDRDGNVVERYAPKDTPLSMKEAIEKLL
ncbi:glutathione peroxidase [Listeria weihenstephanensis FSL R9-0317]|uniref:Glutathione peroxidase n=1 Tax=Listeria weihenstephanensis TaxID=1006155 RepID=A0A1S7FT46_9LIST|nr:glutathione peroxidase [Listeria weihenstephanensis]AQY50562.1 glutathione peroxidase [Listeria weihenstephanensis]EUJ38927.1 glutathione peroxidase [Listeria weihenstephanensis FSL R9-0317]